MDELPKWIEKFLNQTTTTSGDLDIDSPHTKVEDSITKVDLINKIFPDEASLVNLEEFKTKLKKEVELNQERINGLMEQQKNKKDNIQKLKNELKVTVESLDQKLKQIKSKSRLTVEAVSSVGKNIAKLEEAKRNMLTTISTVKKFHMLSTAIDQLEFMVSKRHYEEVGNLLVVIEELLEVFTSFREIEYINEIFQYVSDTKKTLQNQIEVDFQSTFDERLAGGKPCTKDTLKGACSVVNSLSISFRNRVVQIVVDSWLQDYLENYADTTLDVLSTRFDWYARTILKKESQFQNIFPSQWEIYFNFTEKFCTVTSEQINQLLSTSGADNIGAMMRGLKATLNFEEFTAKKYQLQMKGRISSVFEPFLANYIKREQTIIEEQILKASREDVEVIQLVLKGEKERILPSMAALFVAVKNSINRCVQFTAERAFYELYLKFKEIFKKRYYHLNKELKSTIANKTEALHAGASWKFQGFSLKTVIESSETKLNPREGLVKACLVLNSADYAAETLQQLEQSIRDNIHTSYEKDVSLEKEQDHFYKNVSNAVHVLGSQILNGLSPEFNVLLSHDWTKFNEVGDTSPYMTSIGNKIHSYIRLIHPLLSSTYFRSFCDKFAMNLIESYFSSLKQLKKLSQFAAQQFLVDLKSLKSIIIGLTYVVVPENKDSLYENHRRAFEQAVEKRFERIQAVLKIASLGVSLSMMDLIERISLLLGQPSTSELEAISKLRGMEKTTEQELFSIVKTKGATQKFSLSEDVSSMKDKLKNLKLSDINVSSFALSSVMKNFSKS